MSDDFLAGGIIPGDDVLADDPNAIGSDAFLDELDAPLGILVDEDDEMPEDE